MGVKQESKKQVQNAFFTGTGIGKFGFGAEHSPTPEEEGTYGQKEYEDNVPSEIKKERLDELMKLQMDINLNKNKNLINTNQRVIVDTHTQEGFSIGRTFRDSPEIDNSVIFKNKLSIGEFYNAKIIDASHYSLTGEI